MTTLMHVQSPNFVEYKANPGAFAPSGQPWNVNMGHVAPVSYPQQIIAVNPQYGSSTLFHQTFLQGKPKALGVVLVVGGIAEIILGIASVYTAAALSLVSGIDFWGGIINIVAGSLTISAGTRPNICMIKGSLSLNIITAFFIFIAFIFVCVDLAALSVIVTGSYNYYDGYYEEYMRQLAANGIVVLAILLIVNLLLFFVSISVSVFGCKALGQASNTPTQVFVVQNDVIVGMPQPPPY